MNDNAEENEREKIMKKMKEITYIEIGSNNDKRHEKEQTKTTTEGNQIDVEG